MKLRIRNLTRDSVLAERAAVADDSASRRRGLLGRDHLGDGEGLLLHPCEAVHTFGMRFPIDVLFLNSEKRAVKLCHGLRRGRIALALRATSVLELPAGTLVRTETQTGDQCAFEKLPEEE